MSATPIILKPFGNGKPRRIISPIMANTTSNDCVASTALIVLGYLSQYL